jgi:hypothetical protein
MTTTTAAPVGLRARYRAWYETLPTPVQMIGLQIWLPTFFIIAFVFCYVFAFHAPSFKDVPVAVVGPSSSMQAVADQIQTSSKGAVDVSVIGTTADAKDRVRDGELAAAYVPGQGTATLVIASADSFQLASLARQFFQPIAAASHVTLTVDDLAPLPARDSFGTSLFYLTLLCTIAGYMVAMFVGMMGGGLRHWQRFTIFGASSVVLPFVAMLLARFVVGVVDGHFWMLWAIGAATSFAVGCVVNGLAYFFGRFVTGIALLLFVFANVPSSGGAYPPELVPQPFRFLHDFVSGTATIDLLRRTVYGVGPAAWQGWLLLACYAAAGTLLALVGKPYFVAKMRRQRAAGKKSMMVSAQIASLTHAGYVVPAPTAPVTPDGDTVTEDDSTDAYRVPALAGALSAQRAPVSPPVAPTRSVSAGAAGLVVTATAASESGPVELTVRMHRSDLDTTAHGKHGRRSRSDQHDEERGTAFSAEEADGDAIAAETGAAG